MRISSSRRAIVLKTVKGYAVRESERHNRERSVSFRALLSRGLDHLVGLHVVAGLDRTAERTIGLLFLVLELDLREVQ